VSLTSEQLRRREEAEQSFERVRALKKMSGAELRRVLGGDPVEAAPWVRAAAEQGISFGQLRWGAMLMEGQGVEQDPALALHWFTQAARAGNGEAMNMVGRCFENGWGTAIELQRAAHWYKRSAESGHDWGEYNYAHMLFDGTGIPEDRCEALKWYRRAAGRGHARAMNLLARCHEEGWGCEKNPAEAADWYRRSAEAGYFRAQFNHGCILAEAGRSEEAAHWLRLAAEADETIRREIARRPLLAELTFKSVIPALALGHAHISEGPASGEGLQLIDAGFEGYWSRRP